MNAHVFTIEESIENLRERELLEDVSDALTDYAHVVAREYLRNQREKMIQAEAEGNHDLALTIIQGNKEAETLLQNKISIQK
jgi:hypothetical protein